MCWQCLWRCVYCSLVSIILFFIPIFIVCKFIIKNKIWHDGHTFFLSSTEIALASLRKMAFPHKSSRSEVNWWYFHFLNPHAASWYSRSLQLHSASNKGLTEMPSGDHSQTQHTERSQKVASISIKCKAETATYCDVLKI